MSNQIRLDDRKQRTPSLLLFLAVMAILILTNLVGRGRVGQERVNMSEKVDLSVRDGRPVAEAIRMLESNCFCVITYEDPLYIHPSAIDDVTEKVRRDLDKYKPGEAPRVFIPKGGALAIAYEAKPGTKIPVDTEKVVQEIVNANSAIGVSRFRVEKRGEIIHVIATAFKNRAGVLAPQEPVLDVLISLPAEDRNGLDTLHAICAAISQETKTHVVVGTVPLNRFYQHRDAQGAQKQKARDVLMQLIERTGGPTSLSWKLLYDPMMKWYVLNIHGVH